MRSQSPPSPKRLVSQFRHSYAIHFRRFSRYSSSLSSGFNVLLTCLDAIPNVSKLHQHSFFLGNHNFFYLAKFYMVLIENNGKEQNLAFCFFSMCYLQASIHTHTHTYRS